MGKIIEDRRGADGDPGPQVGMVGFVKRSLIATGSFIGLLINGVPIFGAALSAGEIKSF
jgi:hypothetical protein